MSDAVLDIPDDWDVTTLGEVNTLKSRTLVPQSFPEEQFEYYSIPDYQNGEKPGRVKGKTIASAKLQLKPKSVLFGKLNPRVEKVWRVGPLEDLRQIGSTEWLPVLPDERMDPDFLYFLEWSDHVMPKAKKLVSGSTPSRQRVDPSSFYKIEVPLPPLTEQQHIAHVLSTVQEAIAQQERLIRTTTELKQALMQKLFTEGLRGEKQKETEVGMVPESWEVVRLGDVMNCHDGKRKPVTQSDRIPGPYPYFGASGITDYVEGYLFDGDYLLIAEDGENLASRKLPIAFIARGKFWVNNHAHVLSMKRGNLDFNEQYIAQMEIKDYLSGTTRPKLNKGLMMTMKLPWPPVTEQNEIAAALNSCDTKRLSTERKLTSLQDLFRTLLHELMTGKVRVNHNA